MSVGFSVGFGGGTEAGDVLPLLRTFRFRVTLIWSPQASDPAQPPGDPGDGDRICAAGFQDCTGLGIALEHAGIGAGSGQGKHEGGNNGFVHVLPGRATYGPLVFKRGMMYSVLGHVRPDLWYWVQSIAYGSCPPGRMYCDGLIQVMGEGDDVAAKWQFQRGLPSKIDGPALTAVGGQGGIAIETLTIVPGRLWLRS